MASKLTQVELQAEFDSIADRIRADALRLTLLQDTPVDADGHDHFYVDYAASGEPYTKGFPSRTAALYFAQRVWLHDDGNLIGIRYSEAGWVAAFAHMPDSITIVLPTSEQAARVLLTRRLEDTGE